MGEPQNHGFNSNTKMVKVTMIWGNTILGNLYVFNIYIYMCIYIYICILVKGNDRDMMGYDGD